MGVNNMTLKGILGRTLVLVAFAMAIWACVPAQPDGNGPMGADPSAPKKATSTDEKVLRDAQASTTLQNTDCAKCHDTQPANVNKNGGKHRDKVGCLDCHLEHLPLGKQTIPQCAMCHAPASKGHFGLANCLGCHRNPHTPLDITVDDTPTTTAACKTCHADKGEEFGKFPSKHAQVNCTLCHPTKHKQIHKCMVCHKPHADFMAYEDCLRCHKPHSPKNITYADDTPSKYCGSCHAELFNLLTKSKAKHAELNCAYCHKTKHPTVPKCQDCHEQPHSVSLLSSFNQDCLKCHRNPHDLVF